jgi:predicted SprT family Zn-dependent metalloprotease
MPLTKTQKTELQQTVQAVCLTVWAALQAQHTALRRSPLPEIAINARLKSSAGRCFPSLNLVEFGPDFLMHSTEYTQLMFRVIIPHELIHQADYNLYGESEFVHGHGKNWTRLMLQYGLPADRYHPMGSFKR